MTDKDLENRSRRFEAGGYYFRRVRLLGWVGVLGPLATAVTDAGAAMLCPGYNPLVDSVSSLALGPTGWLQDTGLAIGALALLGVWVGPIL